MMSQINFQSLFKYAIPIFLPYFISLFYFILNKISPFLYEILLFMATKRSAMAIININLTGKKTPLSIRVSFVFCLRNGIWIANSAAPSIIVSVIYKNINPLFICIIMHAYCNPSCHLLTSGITS